jgi:sulfotransferase family protein
VLPNFLVIGAMKAGTTSLHRYLREHPQVFMPEEKELDFFVAQKHWDRGRRWYEAQFARAKGAIAVGEASPTYTMYPRFSSVADRIAELLPHARLLYTVRHPIERMRSHYLHEVEKGRERAPMGRALATDPRYLDASRYAMQLDQYLLRFPPERVRVITAEQLRHDRVATIRGVLAFLGVDQDWADSGVLDHEFHRTTDKRVRRPLAEVALRVPGTRALGQLAPGPVRRLATRRLGTGRATALPEALEAHLRAELRNDVGRLRAHLGAGFDGWGIG